MLRIATAFLAVAVACPTFASAQEEKPSPGDPLRSYAERTTRSDIAAIDAEKADADFRRAVGFYVGRNPGLTPRDWAKLEQAKADKTAKDARKIKASTKAEESEPGK